ncbi:MAG: hypothetical protein IPJ66_18700 [Bacteroidetes bacterium]|nr:hypothetical protein [Bacteroidota bacterium]
MDLNKTKPVIKGKCKMCLKEHVVMHKDSHIIPWSFYKRAGLFSEGGKMLYPDHSTGEVGNWKNSKSNNGEYERHIFCVDCELLLKSYEDYGGDLLSNELKEKITRTKGVLPNGFEFIQYGNINYAKLKLFFLSIFWRASISVREIFNLKFDPKVEEDLRLMIVSNDPGPFIKYPIRIVFHLRPSFATSFHVAPPQFAKRGLYRFMFSDTFNAGVIVELYTEPELHLEYLNMALRDDGFLNVDLLNEEESFCFTKMFFGKPVLQKKRLNNSVKNFKRIMLKKAQTTY